MQLTASQVFGNSAEVTPQELYSFPLSFAQQDIWLACQANDAPSYHIANGLTLHGPLDPEILARALNDIVARHEILRTSIGVTAGEPVQMVASEREYAMPLIDLQTFAPEGRQRQLHELAERHAAMAFDLARGPLVRWCLVRLGPERHTLLSTMHHLIFDAWSETLFLHEVLECYACLAGKRMPSLPALPIQYGDFAVWEREWLSGERRVRLADFWRERLAGVRPVQLPVDRPRSQGHSRCAFEIVRVSAETIDALRELARSRGGTLFAALAAGLAAFLWWQSGQDQILFACPAAQRDRIELEPLIGLFLKFLVLRLDLSTDCSFAELLPTVIHAVHEGRDQMGLSIEELSAAARSAGGPADPSMLTRVLFNFENVPSGHTPEAAGLRFETFQIGSGYAKSDLIWNAQDTSSGLLGSLEYDADLFDAVTIRRMAGQLVALLTAIAENPFAPLGELPVLPDSERREQFAFSPAWLGDESRLSPVHEQLEVLSALNSSAIAVTGPSGAVPFGELNRRANQIAHALLARSGGAEILVGIAMNCSVEFVSAALGILKSGGAYIPLDVSAPAERIRRLLEDSRVRCVVTLSQWKSLIPEHLETLCLDTGNINIDAQSTRNPGRAVDSDNLAYVIYTSGSTGHPKGVMVTHGALAHYLAWCRDYYPIREGRTVLVHGSPAADLSVTSLFTPLLAGRTLTFSSPAGGVEDLAARMQETASFGFIKLTPSHLQILRTLLPETSTRSTDALIIGGEALFFEQLAFWRTHAPHVRLINEYGPTEATVACCAAEVKPGDPTRGPVPIGRPTPGVRLYVSNPSFHLLPTGAAGELFIGGPQVARGYLHRPALTAERFVPDPWSEQPGARMYRTGDLVRFRSDLMLEYIGRVDHQVKIRGFRVEPGEVEAVLATCPGIDQAAVIACTDDAGQQELVAYFTSRPGSESDVRSFLARQLPEYMVPSRLVELQQLPLTASGKIDRNALPVPGLMRTAEADRTFAGPVNPMQAVLAAIWCQVLSVEEVGIHDNFYSLGGDSMRSLRIVGLAKARGIRLSMRQIAEHPTIAELALLAVSGGEHPGETAPPEPFSFIREEDRAALPPDVVDAYPLAQMQLGMLFHRELTPSAPLFHSINSYHLRMPLDEEKFRRAVLEVTARHPVLRTSFHLADYSQPLQLVHREAVFPVPVFDLRGLTEEEARKELNDFWAAEARRPFDLSQAPQLRVHLHRRSDETFQYTLTENHAVVDGWTLHVLFDETIEAYFALLETQQLPPWRPLKTSYSEFILAEQKILESSEARAFWEAQMQGYKAVKLPRLAGAHREQEHPRVRRIDRLLPGGLVKRLRSLAREMAVPLKSVLLAAHLKTMAFLTGETDVVTGLSSNGRLETEDGDRVCGLFLNTIPFRMSLAEGSWTNLIQKTSDAELRIMPFRRYPVSAIQSKWGAEPLFDTSFVYLNFHVLGEQIRSGRIQYVDTGAFVEETNFAIMTAFQHLLGKTSRIALSVCADRWVLSDAQIRLLTGYYLKTLEAIAATPTACQDIFSPMQGPERQQVVALGTGELRPLSSPAVHERFAAVAESAPRMPCLSFGGAELSYEETRRQSNQIAGYLASLGVGPEDRVAIGMDHRPEMILAMLAILKLGACYVPIDPASPPDRTVWMLNDADVRAVLTLNQWRRSFSGAGLRVVAIDTEWWQIAAQSDAPVNVKVDPRQLACIIYTSGSSGRPKGVAVEHRQLANYTDAAIARLELPEKGHYGLISTFAADLGNTMIFPALCAGGCLHIFSARECTDPVELAKELEARPIDCLKIVPSHFAALFSQPDSKSMLPGRRLIFGGEAVDWRMIERLNAVAPECRIFNHYGPTETTVGVVAGEVPRSDENGGSATAPMGQPLLNTRLYVLDETLNPTPVGAGGQLYVGGAGVSRGYWRNPRLTADSFVPDHMSGEPGARLYRTGDRVRWLQGGSLEFLGRRDNQVKIRGHRVELGEIEEAVRACPGILAAAAIAIEQEGERRLAAFAVPAAGSHCTENDLTVWLAARLPAAALPRTIQLMEALPVTSNGKVDRRQLAESVRAGTDRPRIAPSTPIEAELARIWQSVLNTHELSVHDSFFEAGGSSLSGILLAARIRKSFSVSVSVEDVFAAATIAGMAALVEGAQPGRARQETPVSPVPRGGPLPLSFSQRRFWFAWQMDPVSTANTIALAVRLEGELDQDALESSLREVMRRHEVLRTTFRLSDDGDPVQLIASEFDVPLAFADLNPTPAETREAIVSETLRNSVWQPFDLERGPVFRPVLLRVGPRDHILAISVHHIAFDGWSIAILLRELSTSYSAFRGGTPPPLPEPALHFADFAVWQRSVLTSQVQARQLAWWLERLDGMTLLELPLDDRRARTAASTGGSSRVRFSLDLTRGIRRFSRQQGITLFMFHLATLGVLLRELSGQDDVTIGCPVANHRDRAELQNVVGPFLNTLAIRILCEKRWSLRQLLQHIRKAVLDAYANQDVPFEQVAEALAARRGGRGAVFRVWLNHSDARDVGEPLSGLKAQPVDLGETEVKFDLMFSTELTGEQLEITARYNTQLFSGDSIRALLLRLELLSGLMMETPDAVIEELPGILVERSSNGEDASGAAGDGVLQQKLRASRRRAVSIGGA